MRERFLNARSARDFTPQDMQEQSIAPLAQSRFYVRNWRIALANFIGEGRERGKVRRRVEILQLFNERLPVLKQHTRCKLAACHNFCQSSHLAGRELRLSPVLRTSLWQALEPVRHDCLQLVRQRVQGVGQRVSKDHGLQSSEKMSAIAGYTRPMPESRHLLIVFHSQSGSTSRMADAVIAGATDDDVDGVEVRVVSALEANAEDLLWCDGFILGTPENFGYMSGAMKYFLDRAYYECEGKVNGKPYALFIRAGNDGSGALTSMRRILTGLAVREVQEPVMIVGNFDESRLDDCKQLGLTLAAGLEAGVF